MAKSTESTDAKRGEETATDEREDERATEERAAEEAEEGRKAQNEQTEETEQGARDEGRRAVSFERATEALAEAFGIDRRRGETITDLETTETEQGRQLVATVKRRRTTAVREKVRSAKRTGRKVGRAASVLGTLAAVAYGVRRARRLRRGKSGEDGERAGGADISIDERSQ